MKPKKLSGKAASKNKNNPKKSPPPARSLVREVQMLEARMAATQEQARSAGKKTRALYQAAGSLHSAADQVHHRLKTTEAHLHTAEKDLDIKQPHKPKPFIIVGVGASAGGFEAFTSLLDRLSPETGMAFVLVQHLDPTHESKLTELLSHGTRMKVVEIQNDTLVEPNHVYVIPPNRVLTISGGMLKLRPRRRSAGLNLPIDTFFESLAMDQGNRAVGVILSGNGVDGTHGLKLIKAEGGITFVQDEQSAKFYAMPGSALRAGCVDFVLSPPDIAKELERISRFSPLRRARAVAKSEPPLPGTDTELTKIFGLLRALTGVDFTYYKLTTLKRRITRRMVLKKIPNLREYLKHLQQNPTEVDLLFQDILINVTGFFRDAQAFSALKKKIFPRLLSHRPSGSPIRVWVPGCSTGEEVYSLAICLHEFLGKSSGGKAMQVFGTDISETMVGRARMGIYPENIASHITPERLRRYFQKADHGYQIAKFIRDACIFARQNVAEDPPFSKLDLISCRNLLIYLGPILQRKIMPIFHYSLRAGGFMMLGSSETVGPFSNLFSLVDKKNKIYTKVETTSRPEMDFPTHSEVADPRPAKTGSHPTVFDPQHRADEILLSHYTPGGVVVNARMEVLHFRGRTGYYLEPASGAASLNLLKIVREELAVDIRTAFSQAAKSNLPVRKDPVRIRYNGHYRLVAVEAVPFKVTPSSEWFYLILFHDMSGAMEVEHEGAKKSDSERQHSRREIRRLREEIAQTRESLQTIIEEQEATNEELKSANEEIQSSNEELQSTNEELETAKEELQSTNEELTTLNEELQNRNVELSQVNNDLNNLIASFNMPMLMLGDDLTIRRFTPLAEKLFNLIPADIGRRLSHINANIAVPNLDKMVADVIDTLNMRQIEVQDRQGNWFSLRVRPYRTSENKIEGAVIVLVDIGDIRQSIGELTEMASDPILILGDESRVSKANAHFCQLFKTTPREIEGRVIFDLAGGQWNIPAFRKLVERLLPESKRVKDYIIEHDFPNIGRRKMSLNARWLYQQSKGVHYVVIGFNDITGK